LADTEVPSGANEVINTIEIPQSRDWPSWLEKEQPIHARYFAT